MNYDQLIKIEAFAKSYYKKLIPCERIWEDHIRLVRKFAKELALIENGDKDVVYVAAILHDIGKYKGNYNHSDIVINYPNNSWRIAIT